MNWLWISVVVVALDQVTKHIAVAQLALHEPLAVAPVLNLTLTYNAGAAFSLNLGSPFLHTAVSIIALGALVYLYRTLTEDERLLRFALCLVLGGAVGNIIDRLYLGAVVDFFDFGFGDEPAWE